MDRNRESPPQRLVIANVTAGYGGPPVVSNISLDVGSGEVVCIIGPNGAGKSTLLKAIMGMIQISKGTVALADENVTGLPAHLLARKGVGYVPQNNDVFTPLSVRENLDMGGYLLPPKQVAERMEAVLAIFPALASMLDRLAGRLSGGERKMLAVGRVLMLKPSVLVLDEPTANLSPDLSELILGRHVRRLANLGTAVLLVEQKVQAALKISDRAYVLVSGMTIVQGTAADVLARPDLAEIFLGNHPRQSLSAGSPASLVYTEE